MEAEVEPSIETQARLRAAEEEERYRRARTPVPECVCTYVLF